MFRFYLILLLAVAFILRVINIQNPTNYIFDEVYHVPSLRAFSQNNPEAFDVFAKAPEPNTAYDWLHPPLAKLFQAGSVLIFGDNSFGWRFPAAVFGTLAVAGVYFLTLAVTKKTRPALLAAALFSLDGLQLTMSRIAMNDIFVTAFIVFALAFFYKKNWWWAAVFTGLAVSTKHSAALLLPILTIFCLWKRSWKALIYLALIPPLIYFLSFSQFWLQGHSWQQFVDLHRQIYWYQTHLEATHDYQSAAWQWPVLARPVWFHVEYLNNKVANIYNLGNPVVFWLGLAALFQGAPLFLVVAYLGLWLPFLASPRIMFFHHYLPALAVLTAISGAWLDKLPAKVIKAILLLAAVSFTFFYPINTAVPLPSTWLKYWFIFPGWR